MKLSNDEIKNYEIELTESESKAIEKLKEINSLYVYLDYLEATMKDIIEISQQDLSKLEKPVGQINKLVFNFLNSLNVLVNNLKRIFGQLWENIDSKFNNEYRSYRLLKVLRGYSSHYSFPISKVSTNKSKKPGELPLRNIIHINVSVMLKERKPKIMQANKIAIANYTDSDSIDLIMVVNEFKSIYSSLKDEIRSLIIEQTIEYLSTITNRIIQISELDFYECIVKSQPGIVLPKLVIEGAFDPTQNRMKYRLKSSYNPFPVFE